MSRHQSEFARFDVAVNTTFPLASVTPETELAVLGLGSLDTITLLFEIEEAFDITIPNNAIPEIITVRDMIDNLQQHVTPSGLLAASDKV